MRLLVALAVALFVVFVLPIIRRVWSMYRASKRPVSELMPWFAEHAVRDAATRGVSLDFSIDSIKRAEELLGTLHDSYVADPTSVKLTFTAMSYGAYIGESIKRSEPSCQNDPQCGWQRDHAVAGPGSYPFSWGGGESFPTAWCHKRIVNGDEDNVWVKYVLLRDRLAGKAALVEF